MGSLSHGRCSRVCHDLDLLHLHVYLVIVVVSSVLMDTVSQMIPENEVINPHLPSGPVHLYHLDETISNFRDVWRSTASDLGLHCSPTSQNGTLGLYGLINYLTKHIVL